MVKSKPEKIKIKNNNKYNLYLGFCNACTTCCTCPKHILAVAALTLRLFQSENVSKSLLKDCVIHVKCSSVIILFLFDLEKYFFFPLFYAFFKFLASLYEKVRNFLEKKDN